MLSAACTLCYVNPLLVLVSSSTGVFSCLNSLSAKREREREGGGGREKERQRENERDREGEGKRETERWREPAENRK